jgi:hypothetical protein
VSRRARKTPFSTPSRSRRSIFPVSRRARKTPFSTPSRGRASMRMRLMRSTTAFWVRARFRPVV